MSIYTIAPLNVGLCTLGKDHVLGDEYSPDDRLGFALISYLVRGDGRNVLVDLGPKTVAYTNDMFRRYGFLRTLPDGSTPDDIVQPEGNVFDGLALHGLSPQDVTDIVFTHLHADHHGLDDATDGGACEDFPNAVFHLSRTGWDYHLERRADGRWNSYIDWAFGDFLLRTAERGRLIAADDEAIAPGLATVYLGGHSVCSQGIRIETAQGTAFIAGDDCYHYDLLRKRIVARIHTSRERYVQVTETLAKWAAEGTIILPGHEPAVLDLYREHGDDWLAAARELL